MKKAFSVLIFCIYLITACKKDSKSNDSVIAQNINGQVYNFCTDSGLAGVTVYLKIYDNNNISNTMQAVSGVNGSFSFNTPVHSSDDYKYELYIPSQSGIGNVGFEGVDGYVIKNNINQSQLLEVVPHSHFFQLYFPNTLFTSNDTFILTTQQNIFHKNIPSGIWQSIENCSPCNIITSSHYIGNLSDYPMGWWQVTLDKTHNGVHIIKTDSFYVGWGATVTDTIPW